MEQIAGGPARVHALRVAVAHLSSLSPSVPRTPAAPELIGAHAHASEALAGRLDALLTLLDGLSSERG